MDIEKGEAFVVVRGVKFNNTGFPGLSALFGIPDEPKDGEPTYDRSYAGCVFRATEVCGPMIAAEWIGGRQLYGGVKRVSFNTSEVEVWPVTEDYAAAFAGTSEGAMP
jgi:hypothetical protein